MPDIPVLLIPEDFSAVIGLRRKRVHKGNSEISPLRQVLNGTDVTKSLESVVMLTFSTIKNPLIGRAEKDYSSRSTAPMCRSVVCLVRFSPDVFNPGDKRILAPLFRGLLVSF